MNSEAWKEWVLGRMRSGKHALRAKGKTVQQIVRDAYSATGLSDVALATKLLKGDARFTTGDKLSRWVPAESADLVAETLRAKEDKRAARVARKLAAQEGGHKRPADFGGDAPRGRKRARGGGGAAPTVFRARIEVEDTTQTAQRYVDQLNSDVDSDDSDDDDDSGESQHDEHEAAVGEAQSAAHGLLRAATEDAPQSGKGQTEDCCSSAATVTVPVAAARAAVLENYFFASPTPDASAGSSADFSRCVLVDRSGAAHLKECALLGVLSGHLPPPPPASSAIAEPLPPSVFLNTHQPFCLVTVGVQGGGKSHTLACVLESVLLQAPSTAEEGIIKLTAPQNALVLHYDQNVTSVCEATGLVHPHPALSRALRRAGAGSLAALPRDRMVVLVSSSYYLQRKAFYGDYCDVRPLLFRW
jgi:hypothetical protein